MHLLHASKQGKYKEAACELAKQRLAASSSTHWGSLAPLSENAKNRSKGANMTLDAAEHVLGRLVASAAYAFDQISVSARHCKILRRLTDSAEIAAPSVFVVDSSSNGTWINGRRLEKNGPEALLSHGDILSLVGPSEGELAWVYAYLEVEGAPLQPEPALPPAGPAPSNPQKRRLTTADGSVTGESQENKRGRIVGNGSMQGPVSLADFKGMQRANEELRQQLEDQAQHIATLTAAQRSTQGRHEAALKDAASSVEAIWRERVEGLERDLAASSRQEANLTAEVSQLASEVADVKQRMASAAQSRADAEAVIVSLRGNVEEAVQRAKEARAALDKARGEAELEKQAAVERERAKWHEERARAEETKALQLGQLQDQLTAAQESEREQRAFAEDLRAKLESLRNAHVDLQEQQRRLAAQLEEERCGAKRAFEALASAEQRLREAEEGLGTQQAARENADQRIQQLEASIETSQRALELERQRVQGARERVMLREAQLRAFHSTAAQIAELQKTQQEQLHTLIRVLEDDDEADEEGGDDGGGEQARDGGIERGAQRHAAASFLRPPSSLPGLGSAPVVGSSPIASIGVAHGREEGPNGVGVFVGHCTPQARALGSKGGALSAPLSQEATPKSGVPSVSRPDAAPMQGTPPPGATPLAPAEDGDTQEEGGGALAGSETEDQGVGAGADRAIDETTSEQRPNDVTMAAGAACEEPRCVAPGAGVMEEDGREAGAMGKGEPHRGATRVHIADFEVHSTLPLGGETLAVVDEDDEEPGGGVMADANDGEETMRMDVDGCRPAGEGAGHGSASPAASLHGMDEDVGTTPRGHPAGDGQGGQIAGEGELLQLRPGPSTQRVPAGAAGGGPPPSDSLHSGPPPASRATSADLLASELPGTWGDDSPPPLSADAQAEIESLPGEAAGGAPPGPSGGVAGRGEATTASQGEPQLLPLLEDGLRSSRAPHHFVLPSSSGRQRDSQWSQQSDSNNRADGSPAEEIRKIVAETNNACGERQ